MRGPRRHAALGPGDGGASRPSALAARFAALMRSPRQIRVAVFIDAKAYGGAERATVTLLRLLDRSRFSPLLLVHGDAGIERMRSEAADAGIPVRVVPRMPDGLAGAVRCLSFARVLRRERVEILHVQLTWPLNSKFALAAGILARVPAVLATVHCVDPDVTMTRPTERQQRLLGRRVARYVAVSRYVKEKLERELPWPADRIVVVYDGVDAVEPAQPGDAALREQLAGPRALPIVLAASNLFPVKGVDILVEAAAHVPAARFVVAGEGPEHEALVQRVAALGIGDRVTLLGWRDDVSALLRVSDVFVLSSRGDALSLSVLEALSAGTPIVTTRVGGLPEAVEDGVSGIVVAPEDPQALAAAINALLADPEMRRRIAAAGQRSFVERFSATAMTAGIQAVYEDVLNGALAR